jgi:hypothetical protein
MLALTDEALARLAIGASRMPVHARDRWLLAQKPRSAGATPASANGGAIYRLTGRLTEVEALDHVRVQRALAAGSEQAPPDLINVCFGPLWGLKSDISRGPRSANSRHFALQQGRGKSRQNTVSTHQVAAASALVLLLLLPAAVKTSICPRANSICE